jgi:ubiquinone/menaquinone biosynthesis C-methylase UbiE
MEDNQLQVRSPEYILKGEYFSTGDLLPMVISWTQESVWGKLWELNPLQTIAFRSLYELRHRMDDSINFWKNLGTISCADVMCGAGAVGYFLHQYLRHHEIQHTLDYIDWSQAMLDNVQHQENTKANTILSDVKNLDSLNKKYDIITIRFWLNNLTTLTDWENAINSCLRSLKPEGKLYIIDHFWAGDIANRGFNMIEEFIAKLDGRNRMPIFPSSDQMRNALDKASNRPSMNKKTQHDCAIESWWNSFFPAEFRLYDRISEKNKRWQYDPPLKEEEIMGFVVQAWEKIKKEFGTTNAFISVPWYIIVYEICRSTQSNWVVQNWFSMRQ